MNPYNTGRRYIRGFDSIAKGAILMFLEPVGKLLQTLATAEVQMNYTTSPHRAPIEHQAR
jgi:hypothetical protein